MSDLESYRIQTRSGRFRGLVYTHLSGRLVMKTQLDERTPICVACECRTYDSMKELEAVLRKKRWKLEMVRWFT